MWESDDRSWACGLAEWEGRKPSYNNFQDFKRTLQLPETVHDKSLSQVLIALFNHLNSPVELDDLVEIITELRLNIEQTDAVPVSDFEDQLSRLQDKTAGKVEQRLYLEQVWEEIRALPLGQRTALLLGLKDAQGCELVTLLAHLRIATLPQIAEALALSAERLTQLWNALPADDATIAKHLGVTRQQVVNLRLSARRRLARRLKTKAIEV